MSLALKFRTIRFEQVSEAVRSDPAWRDLAAKFHISAPAEIDQLYPRLRPARVTVTTARGKFMRQADEALGSRLVPLDDAGLKAKFLDLVEPVHGAAKTAELTDQLWEIETLADVSPLVEALAKPAA